MGTRAALLAVHAGCRLTLWSAAQRRSVTILWCYDVTLRVNGVPGTIPVNAYCLWTCLGTRCNVKEQGVSIRDLKKSRYCSYFLATVDLLYYCRAQYDHKTEPKSFREDGVMNSV